MKKIMGGQCVRHYILNTAIRAFFTIALLAIYLLECRPLCGPVAQLVRAGDSSEMVRLCRKAQNERDEFREPLAVRLLATLSQAASALAEGAENT
jgi:hypothetical protein